MVGLLSQMEGSDRSVVANNEQVAAAEQPVVGVIDSAGVVESVEGPVLKEETLTAEMSPETDNINHSSEADSPKNGDSHVDNTPQNEEGVVELKSILKRRGQYTMRKVKVDFDLIPKRIPYDETKDYTVEIQIVDKEPVKIKSWAALFAAQKAEAEAEEAANAEAEAALKKAEEVQRREALKRANKAKLLKKPVDIISVKEDLLILKDVENGRVFEEDSHVEDKPAKLDVSLGDNGTPEETAHDMTALVRLDDQPQLKKVEMDGNFVSMPGLVLENQVEDQGRLQGDAGSSAEVQEGNQIPENIISPSDSLIEQDSSIELVAASLVDEVLSEVPFGLNVSSDTSITSDILEDTQSSAIDRYQLVSEQTVDEFQTAQTESAHHRSENPTEDQQTNQIVANSQTLNPTSLLWSENCEEHRKKPDREKLQPTADEIAKVSNAVVSNKLNESLKKATPDIINTAVRVLVDVEKITLAVVSNLEPIVP